MRYPTFDEAKERAAQDGTEYQGVVGGQLFTGLFDVPLSERRKHLPKGELQATNYGDMSDCASRSPVNVIAGQFTRAYRLGLIKLDNARWLEEIGAVEDMHLPLAQRRVDFSDADVAIGSGTTRQGNSLKGPIHFIHDNGLIPKRMLPLEPWMGWDDYHNPKRITPAIDAVRAEFKRRFTINYYQVRDSDFADALKTHEICAGGHAWPSPVDGLYPRTDATFNHAFELFEPRYFAFDNYPDAVDGDWIKKLAANFAFFDWGYYLVVTKDITPEERKIELTVFEVLKQYGLLDAFAAWWEDFTTKVRGMFEEDRSFGRERHPGWSNASRAFILSKGKLCDFGLHKPSVFNPLNTHHIRTFHDAPEEEMNPSNWIVLCRLHHWIHGHFKNWKLSNPNIKAEADAFNASLPNRP